MESDELKVLWQNYEAGIEKNMALNQKIIFEIQSQKFDNKLLRFKRNQVLGVVVGIVWILFLLLLVYGNQLQNLFFTFSIGLLALFNIYAVAKYIYHLNILSKVDLSQGVITAQKQIAAVHYSLINVGRVLFLQAPLYCTFYYSEYLVKHAGALFWTTQLVVVSLFLFISIFLYKNITFENLHKKWVRKWMESLGGKTLSQAIQQLKELEEFESDKN